MPGLRQARTLAIAFALTFTQAAPAVAFAPGAGAFACGPEATARGGFADSHGTIREKDTGQVAVHPPSSATGTGPTAVSVTVPVWFHEIRNGSTGDITPAMIAAQIAQLNEGYGGGEGGTNTGFSFQLAGTTDSDNANWYRSKGGAEKAFKQALKRGGPETLNVYSTSGGGYLGWAYLPSITTSSQAYLDGVVIDWRTIPGASTAYAGRYDQGDTLIHEVGHWLNLEHTFYGGCSATGDFVADTPPEKSAAYGCQTGRDTCTSAGLDPIHNYMDYSDDPCLTEFTQGQTARMADAWVYWRAAP